MVERKKRKYLHYYIKKNLNLFKFSLNYYQLHLISSADYLFKFYTLSCLLII